MPAIIPILIGVAAYGGVKAIKKGDPQAPKPLSIKERLFAKRDAKLAADAAAAAKTEVPALGSPAPPDVGRAASEAHGAALMAADRTRRRGAASMLLTQPKPTGRAVKSVLSPRALSRAY